MTALSMRSSNPAIREVSRGLAAAQDKKILQVVAMVDAMPNRGAADQLIAPLRDRLARLRPPRPLRFARLLFLPLDPLIVPAARWQTGQPAIPRTVIPLLAAKVQAGLGALGQTIGTMIEGRTTANQAVVDEAGAILWRNAAQMLVNAPLPEGWETTGLAVHVHRPLTRRIGALLFQAGRLRRMMSDAAQGVVPPEPEAVRDLLEDAGRHDPDIQPMALALLLARVPETASVLPRVAILLGHQGGYLLRHAGEMATDILLDQLGTKGGAEGQLGGQDLAEAGATVRRLTSLLGAIEVESLSADQRERLLDVRERIRSCCEALFAERLTTDLMEPLAACAGEDTLWELETAARGLRALETEARRAGGEKAYDALLGQAAAVVREKIVRGELDRIGGVRLMEIVAGPDAALALLGEEG